MANISRIPPKKKPEDMSPNAGFTDQQRLFVRYMAREGLSPVAAARMAGYKESNIKFYAYDLMKQPKIKNAIAAEQAEFAIASQMTKKKVIDGFLESIQMGRMQGDGMVMLSGFREIGKMCGFYEPTKSKVEVSVNGKVLVEKMQSMSDQELLEWAEGTPEAIEGDFRVIDDNETES